MQTKVNTNWFKQQLASREMSMRELAKKMELDPSSVVGILKRGYTAGTFSIVRTLPHGPVLEDQAVVGANAVLWIRPR